MTGQDGQILSCHPASNPTTTMENKDMEPCFDNNYELDTNPPHTNTLHPSIAVYRSPVRDPFLPHLFHGRCSFKKTPCLKLEYECSGCLYWATPHSPSRHVCI